MAMPVYLFKSDSSILVKLKYFQSDLFINIFKNQPYDVTYGIVNSWTKMNCECRSSSWKTCVAVSHSPQKYDGGHLKTPGGQSIDVTHRTAHQQQHFLIYERNRRLMRNLCKWTTDPLCSLPRHSWQMWFQNWVNFRSIFPRVLILWGSFLRA